MIWESSTNKAGLVDVDAGSLCKEVELYSTTYYSQDGTICKLIVMNRERSYMRIC